MDVTHHIECGGCGRPVTVVFEPVTPDVPLPPRGEQPWSCPHGCGFAEHPQLRGRVLKILAGHVDPR